MRRPPLQELPLYQFLPVVQDTKQHHVRMNKRPLSPGATPIISPAKRRNLDIFSPERTFKSPQSLLRNSFISPMKFSEVLAGPASPAKVLDFGVPRHLAGDPEKRSFLEGKSGEVTPTTPVRPQPSTSRLAPSPEMKPQVVRPSRHSEVTDVFFYSPDARPQSSSSTSSNTSYLLIPRELPPRLDPYSIHYPGFVVYQDPHLVAFTSESQELDRNIQEDDDEYCKENVYIPPPVTKSMATPRGSCKAAEMDGMSSSGKFRPAHSGRTPRPIPTSSSLGTTYKSNTTTSVDRKKTSRRILQDELDFEEDGDTGDE